MAIIYEKKDEIVYITINRPEVMNAIDPETMREIIGARRDFNADDRARVAIISGAGDRAFSAGVDLKKTVPPAGDPARSVAAQFWKPEWQISSELFGAFDISKPMIAAIGGYCLAGGLELALSCDIRIASENAVFGMPEVQIGSMPGGGATQRLARLLPPTIAIKMLLTGERLDAKQALQWGLVSDVVPLLELMATAERIARRIADCAPLSVKAVKMAVMTGSDLSLEKGLLVERLLFGMLRDTQDRIEGRKAFGEKRKPDFKGM